MATAGASHRSGASPRGEFDEVTSEGPQAAEAMNLQCGVDDLKVINLTTRDLELQH